MRAVLPYTYDPEQKKLTVRGARTFPREIFDIAEAIEILDMSGGQLSSLPDDLGRLINVRVAFFSNNDFEEVPPVLSACQKLELVGFRSCNIRVVADHALPLGLRGLILTDNQIESLPDSIGEYTKLQKLMMAGNQLHSLPKELLGCEMLEIIRFGANNLASSPDWLFQLPNLAWYGDASNPLRANVHSPAHSIKDIAWHDITIGGQLGRSVNNVVYHGLLKNGQAVAVKLFGHALVSDGLPADDMNACLLVGDHPNVIGGIGRLVDAPGGQQGLIMPLVSDEFKVVGKPPDLMTISRDTYSEGFALSVAYTRRLLQSVASAMGHLHSMGVMHGDLYAHNVLADAAGNGYVGDFGAASIYEPGSKGGALRERIDVRAFGHLADELTARCRPSRPDEEALAAKLRQLKGACLGKNTNNLPSFVEIADVLAA